MTAGNFVCTGCGAFDVAPRDRFTEALEYRRLDSLERMHRQTTRLVCRDCVARIKAGEVPADQLPMFTFDQ